MAKSADIGSKRLISLAPVSWVRWVTGDPTVDTADLLSGDFQWIARANDALLRVHSQEHGSFLVANEIQFRPHWRMPKRLRAYAALAEEKYDLPVYPVVINILPPAPGTVIASSYSSEVMGMKAHQDFRVINLWEVDAQLVFQQQLSTLLPFVPILKAGNDEQMVSKALTHLRADANLNELEPLLAFFASFALTTEIVRRIMRWDMTILRESPWYNEILSEGLTEGFKQGMQHGLEQGMQQGMQQGQAQTLLRLIERRFGAVSESLLQRLQRLTAEQVDRVIDLALEAQTLAEFSKDLDNLLGHPSISPAAK